MSTKYKATMPDTGYFVTITIVGCCGHGLQIRAIGIIGSAKLILSGSGKASQKCEAFLFISFW